MQQIQTAMKAHNEYTKFYCTDGKLNHINFQVIQFAFVGLQRAYVVHQ